MSKRNFKIIKNDDLSKIRNDERYVVVDSNTGKVLDNAQGYGYKSYENAYRSYTYKTRSKYKYKKHTDKEQKIKKWLKEHKNFAKALDYLYYETEGNQNKFNSKLVCEMLTLCDLYPEFTSDELIKVWVKF